MEVVWVEKAANYIGVEVFGVGIGWNCGGDSYFISEEYIEERVSL